MATAIKRVIHLYTLKVKKRFQIPHARQKIDVPRYLAVNFNL